MSNSIRIMSRKTRTSSWGELAFEFQHGNQVLAPEDKLRFRLKDDTVAQVSVVSTSYQPNTVMLIFDKVLWIHCMNNTDITACGWAGSVMQEYLNTEVLALLPDDLIEMIQPRTIRQKVNGRVYEWIGRLWLPSRTEVFGEKNDCDIDDTHLPFFKSRMNRMVVDSGDSLRWWWNRTVVSSTYFAFVSTTGNANAYYASAALGVRPCFLVRCG